MKEIIIKPITLTKQGSEGYSRGVPQFDQGKSIFMGEAIIREIATKPMVPQVRNAESSVAGNLTDFFKSQGLDVSSVDARRVIEMMEKAGVKSQDVGGGLQSRSTENAQIKAGEKQSEAAEKKETQRLLRPGSGDAVGEAENAWVRHNEERILPPEEKVKQRLLRALGKKPGEVLSSEQSEEVRLRVAELVAETPVRYGYTREFSQTLPVQEALRKRNEERLTPMDAQGRLRRIEPAGITDSRFQEIATTYNRKLGKGLIEYGEIEKAVQELEERLGDASVPPNEKTWARGTIDALEASMMEARQQREADQEKSERSYIERETGQKKYKIEELISEREKRDEVFNDLFAGVDSTPHEFFDRAFNPLTYGMRYETFMDLIREASVGKLEGSEHLTDDLRKDLAGDFIRYQTERRVRQTLHDVNAAVYITSLTGEQLYEHMQNFSSELQDFAFRETGVKQMTDILEQSIRESMQKRDGYLDPQQIAPQPKTRVGEDGVPRTIVEVGEIELNAKARFRERLAAGKIVVTDNDGVAHPIAPNGLQPWEVDRIFTVARGMMISTERLISLAAESKLPKDSFASLFLNDIVKTVSPYQNAIGKFGVSEKDIAAYLYKQDERASSESKSGRLHSLFGFLERWSPSALKEVLKKYESGPYDNFMNDIQNENDMRYIMLRNPNRAGDIFTWLSWRMQESPDNISMSQAFLQKGRDAMAKRVRERFGMPATNLNVQSPNIDYEWNLSEKQVIEGKLPEKGEIITANLFNQLRQAGNLPPQWENIKDFHKYLNEYSNWLGTGLRLERIRTSLSMKEDELRELRKLDKKKASDVDGNRVKGETILKQMIGLQPHRLYMVSADIQARINYRLFGVKLGSQLSEEQQAVLSSTLDDLQLVEQALLADRENLLDRGLTFDGLTLDGHYEAIVDADPARAVERRNRAMEFAKLIREDFAINELKYRDEFLRMKREWKHAYVLWSGDAPVDEFNATVLGPNAAVARRARDNKAQGEAVTLEVKLLQALKDAATPDQIYGMLAPIYSKVTDYDAGKAKQVIAEKVEGIIKFYQADTLTNVPVLGELMRQTGLASFAQLTYQSKRAGVWQASDCNYLLDQLVSHNYLERWQYNALKAKVHASKADVAVDISSTMSQFVAVALAWYLAEKLLKGEK